MPITDVEVKSVDRNMFWIYTPPSQHMTTSGPVEPLFERVIERKGD